MLERRPQALPMLELGLDSLAAETGSTEPKTLGELLPEIHRLARAAGAFRAADAVESVGAPDDAEIDRMADALVARARRLGQRVKERRGGVIVDTEARDSAAAALAEPPAADEANEPDLRRDDRVAKPAPDATSETRESNVVADLSAPEAADDEVFYDELAAALDLAKQVLSEDRSAGESEAEPIQAAAVDAAPPSIETPPNAAAAADAASQPIGEAPPHAAATAKEPEVASIDEATQSEAQDDEATAVDALAQPQTTMTGALHPESGLPLDTPWANEDPRNRPTEADQRKLNKVADAVRATMAQKRATPVRQDARPADQEVVKRVGVYEPASESERIKRARAALTQPTSTEADAEAEAAADPSAAKPAAHVEPEHTPAKQKSAEVAAQPELDADALRDALTVVAKVLNASGGGRDETTAIRPLLAEFLREKLPGKQSGKTQSGGSDGDDDVS